jgi:predicted Holliday junction resolvase-like endonuclease
MQTLRKLMHARGLSVRCPNPECAESFPVREARLFDATKPFPDLAREHLALQRAQIAEERQQLRAERADLKQRSFTSAATSGIGQTLEMVAASLPGLPAAPQDCRVLLRPLDYLAFSGASAGRVHAIRFIEVKSGQGSLSPLQRAIKAAVESDRVRLRVANHRLTAE